MHTAALDDRVPEFRFPFSINFFHSKTTMFHASYLSRTRLPGSLPLFNCCTAPPMHISIHTLSPCCRPASEFPQDSFARSRTTHIVHQGSQRSAALYCCPMDFYVAQPCLFTRSLECAMFAFCVALLSCCTLVPFTTQALSMYGSRPIVHTCPLVFLSAYTEDCSHTYLYAVLYISIVFGKCPNIDQCPPCWGTVLLLAVECRAMRWVLSVVRITGTSVELYQHATHFVFRCTSPGPPRHKVRLVVSVIVEARLTLWFFC